MPVGQDTPLQGSMQPAILSGPQGGGQSASSSALSPLGQQPSLTVGLDL